MRLRRFFCQTQPLDGEAVMHFGQACLLRLARGGYELRGGSWRERQAVKEWASLFCQEAVWAPEAPAFGRLD